MPSLLERRKAIKDRHATLESVPGSGWHPNDNYSPAKKGETPLAQRPVALQDKWETYFVGDCVPQVLDALAKFAGHAATLAVGLGLAGQRDVEKALELAKELKPAPGPDGQPQLAVRNEQYNDLMFALQSVGVSVCAAGAKE